MAVQGAWDVFILSDTQITSSLSVHDTQRPKNHAKVVRILFNHTG